MRTVRVLGVDPGAGGGLAVVSVDPLTGDLRLLGGLRMPTLEMRGKTLVDSRTLSRWLSDYTGPDWGVGRVIIEQVGAMPRQGVTSAFSFGRSTGAVEACVMAAYLFAAVEWVSPAIWKRALGLSSDKQASLDAARLAFGKDFVWTKKADDGIAEAALMAKWAIEQRRVAA